MKSQEREEPKPCKATFFLGHGSCPLLPDPNILALDLKILSVDPASVWK